MQGAHWWINRLQQVTTRDQATYPSTFFTYLYRKSRSSCTVLYVPSWHDGSFLHKERRTELSWASPCPSRRWRFLYLLCWQWQTYCHPANLIGFISSHRQPLQQLFRREFTSQSLHLYLTSAMQNLNGDVVLRCLVSDSAAPLSKQAYLSLSLSASTIVLASTLHKSWSERGLHV